MLACITSFLLVCSCLLQWSQPRRVHLCHSQSIVIRGAGVPAELVVALCSMLSGMLRASICKDNEECTFETTLPALVNVKPMPLSERGCIIGLLYLLCNHGTSL